MNCENCGTEYDPIATRWFCVNCHWKASCCEGEPQPQKSEDVQEYVAKLRDRARQWRDGRDSEW